jgi:aryl-alcohol dehydrogenase-like predicted oxidoreductase
MDEPILQHATDGSNRRQFLGVLGQTAIAGAAGTVAGAGGSSTTQAAEQAPVPGKVRQRVLGKTGLKVSEIGFGGHSWSFKRVPDGNGGFREVTLAEAERMIRLGLEMGVNFFDSCTPQSEHTVPGVILKRLGKRDQVIVSARCCHKMKGVAADKEQVYKFVDERLKLWQTDHFDLLMLTNESNDTPQSGYWEMSHCLEALDKVKQQGKIRFTGFGCHFTPELFLAAIEKYGRAFDVCSLPYNIRHRAAEKIMPAAEKAGLGIVTIKAFARGALLEGRDLRGADAGLPRDMLGFVLRQELVDTCICGVISEAELRENLSASWTPLSPAAARRLEKLATAAGPECGWLEAGWRYA